MFPVAGDGHLELDHVTEVDLVWDEAVPYPIPADVSRLNALRQRLNPQLDRVCVQGLLLTPPKNISP